MTLPIDDGGWFTAVDLGAGLTWITEPRVHRFLRCNIWHLRGTETDVIIDTGLGLVSIIGAFPRLFAGRRVLAVATHYHFDHVGGLHEFTERAIHHLEADRLLDSASIGGRLHTGDFGAEAMAQLGEAGYALPVDADLLTAAPFPGYDPVDYRVLACPASRLLHEGDVIDLGDRALEVLHLPGHSPGSIGLLDRERSILFSGDAVYDGPLLDFGSGSSIPDYVATMERLRRLEVDMVHGGHEDSFDGARLRQLCERYLVSRS